ncbi:hypothetical protein [Pseudovibrio sp. Tun.PSC04-5.I4]|uniref:hypothetical protein n=1 Tax=Pseudovibrio sp. Tun.PSC04-5.I4 TaxID=1798213 RepID=UPI00088D29BB|nr:hypothetical protein [Pseudovibrio sp. Tun.PSC04-5.I4]SDR38311.1 hypothetical protein SAMN04515695_5178 [Pseudovibrio sp. Tun.PSC04-5.I4]
MRILWCLGLLLAGAIMATTEGHAQNPRPLTDYCNGADVLYANGSNGGGPYPILKCGETSVVYNRTDLSFPIAVVQGNQFSQSAANSACQSAKREGASAIVSNLASLCVIELGRGFCSSCN